MTQPFCFVAGFLANMQNELLGGGKKRSSEQDFSIQVVPLSLVGLFSYRTTLLCLLVFLIKEKAPSKQHFR